MDSNYEYYRKFLLLSINKKVYEAFLDDNLRMMKYIYMKVVILYIDIWCYGISLHNLDMCQKYRKSDSYKLS